MKVSRPHSPKASALLGAAELTPGKAVPSSPSNDTAPAPKYESLSFKPNKESHLPTADLYGAPKSKERTAQPRGYPPRTPVPDANVRWDVPLPDYQPATYTAQAVIDQDQTRKPGGWADPPSTTLAQKLHPLDRGAGGVTLGPATQLRDPETNAPMIVPRNPNGRTGLEGRGLLGRWGANSAADAMLTRVGKNGELQLFVIRRKDSGEWALPGGMTEPGENAASTAARELEEEAGVRLDLTAARVVYSGHVDDPRNTDNAWMETTVEHQHLPADVAAALHFKAGDDATDSKWLPVTRENIASLYASHGAFVKQALTGWHEPGLEAQLRSALG